MQAFVPKNRRVKPRFELLLRIIDLNNVPLVSGTAFVKWRLPSSSAPEHHGHTDKAVIVDHRAYWNYEKVLQVRLTIDRNQSLHECELYFEIIQEFVSGGINEKNLLGRIRLNLSEYVDKSDDEDGIVRRYLMQDSKINSTLKAGIAIRQVEGDRNFITPPLKSAMVFGGIAGVVSSEQSEHDELGRLPTINTQSRETTDMQDMYRRTLAASWNSRADDLPADKLIEELFSGGISWADNDVRAERLVEHQSDRLSPNGTLGVKKSLLESRLSPPSSERRPRSSSSNHFRGDMKGAEFAPTIDHAPKTGSIEQQLYDNAKGKAWKSRNTEFELSEFDVREDLRSWEVMDKEAAAGLLTCRLFPECRGNLSNPTLRWRNVSIRSKTTASDPTESDATANDATNSDASTSDNTKDYTAKNYLDDEPIEPQSHSRRPGTLKPHLLSRQRGRRVPLTVNALGNPAEVVLVQERLRGRKKSQLKQKVNEKLKEEEKEKEETIKDALPLFLSELDKDDEYADTELVKTRIESLRRTYKPFDELDSSDWDFIRDTLQSSFTWQQLSDYITGVGRDNLAQSGLQSDHQRNGSINWLPGTSEFLETDISRRGIAERVAAAQFLKGKEFLAEKILRDAWHLSVANEVGQSDVHLPVHALSLLLNSKHFSFDELASLHEANIDVTHTLGLVRITGKRHTCESISEIVHDATSRIRQEDVGFPPEANVNNHIFTSDFLSWVTKTYGVVFEHSKPHTLDKIFYLVENKQGLDNARRVLNLAYHSATAPPVPFSTYVYSSERATVHNVDPEHNTTWFERQKSWFRWGLPTAKATEVNTSDTPFFNTHQTRISDQLLKLLRNKRYVHRTNENAADDIQESVTAAVGRCLFLRKPSFEESTVNASQLGQMALPRTFTTDIPRAAPFLRKLTHQPSNNQHEAYRIRLVPSALHANILPQLELELTAKTTRRSENPDPDFAMRSAKMILAESHLDFLLPENGLDLRFTRRLTRELLNAPRESFSLEALEETLRALFTRCATTEGDVPFPTSTRITLPREIVGEDMGATEYTFLPMSDVRGTRFDRYEFRGHQLHYAFYESGPFNPDRTMDMFLNMDLPASNSTAIGAEPDFETDTLQANFHYFYKTACALAFQLDRAQL
ncbi:hypothetical protein BO71DRAFT_352119 [Aspergillus ellipticus CBS 707.79]|uniref:C2 NT-type domain-containing protein n=1 Tax=Aspergillus ellipticus CBS 707.79 TaxID=1448320 RepID=A0A319DLN0_9EURO|nr:hypothetical protein BO71DRAFT_352119 [Aspergillus ellipticus CBS 707.79]